MANCGDALRSEALDQTDCANQPKVGRIVLARVENHLLTAFGTHVVLLAQHGTGPLNARTVALFRFRLLPPTHA
jgi:hypothetical protein